MEGLRYNLNAEGYISEIGYMENYQYEMLNSEIHFHNFQRYRNVEGNWEQLSEQEYLERYATALAE